MADESRWSEDDRFGRRDEGPRYSSYRDRYGRDYGEPYRGYGREAGYGGPRARGQFGSSADRHWWERASDEVSSWFGDQEAERRRDMDAAERGHRGRGPKGYVRSDERIREDACDRLSDDHIVDASNIDVAVAGSEVTLSGTVDSREERRRAEECVERVSGVSHVQNNLRVAASGGTPNAGMGRTTTPPGNTGTPIGRASH